jgi:hypothetical protein
MAGAFKKRELLRIHQKLKAKQDSLEPYLTFSIMMQVLHYKSPNSVQNVLGHLISMGLVEVHEFGDIKRYRILDRTKTKND